MSEEAKTVLHVRPIDPDEPGSYRLRRKFLEMPLRLEMLQKQADEAEKANDGDAKNEALTQATQIMIDMEDLLISRCHTDNGTPVREIIDEMSANEFDELYKIVNESTVPTESAGS